MSSKFRKYLANPKNASKLTEQIIMNDRGSGEFSVKIDDKSVTMRQIGISIKK